MGNVVNDIKTPNDWLNYKRKKGELFTCKKKDLIMLKKWCCNYTNPKEEMVKIRSGLLGVFSDKSRVCSACKNNEDGIVSSSLNLGDSDEI